MASCRKRVQLWHDYIRHTVPRNSNELNSPEPRMCDNLYTSSSLFCFSWKLSEELNYVQSGWLLSVIVSWDQRHQTETKQDQICSVQVEASIYTPNRRKFRSQTSDNMDRWKSRGGKSQGGEEKKWEDQRREKMRRKKRQVREKVGKSRFTVFFQWFVAPEGQKVTSLKWRARSHLARWEMKNCTPLWR